MQKYFDVVLSSDGSPVTGVNVTVKLNGTNTLASLFSDAAGTVPLANPVVTDTRGTFQFYAADGRYDLTFTATNFSTYTFTDIAIDEQDSAGSIAFTPAGGISASTVAGALTELDSDKENAGMAASSMSAHLAASDPHSQYMTKAEADAAYQPISAGGLSTTAIGYDVGAGGAVTQLTSKATTVVLNELSGKVTTAADALGAGVTTAFNVTNSNVTANDLVILTKASDAADAHYQIWPAVAGGAFAIYIKNISGGSRSEAIIINFAIIKAAVS